MSEVKRKNFRLTTEHIDFIDKVKMDNGLKTENAAMIFILEEYARRVEQSKSNQELAELVSKQIQSDNSKILERLKWATETSEKNSIYILDCINTMLFNQNIYDCTTVDFMESPVIKVSRETYKEKLDHFKQAKEDRKLRKKLKEEM